MSRTNFSRNYFTLFTIFGIFFGLSFPIMAILVDAWIKKQPLSWEIIGFLHQTNPLHYIIDTAPLILGLVFAWVGYLMQKLAKNNQNLEIEVDRKSQSLLVSNEELRQSMEELEQIQQMLTQQNEEVEKQNIFQKAILDNAALMIITIDTRGIITSFNPAAERELGYSAEEVINKHNPALFMQVDEIPRKAAELSQEFGEEVPLGFGTLIFKAMRGLPSVDEWTFIRKDKSTFPSETRLTSLFQNDRLIGFIGLAENISQQKEAEMLIRQQNEELQASQESLQESFEELQTIQTKLQEAQSRLSFALKETGIGIWEFDFAKGFFIWDKACKAIFGLEEHEDLSHEMWESKVNPEDLPALLTTFTQFVMGTIQFYSAEYRTVPIQGKEKYLVAKAILFRNDDGKPKALIGTLEDISLRKLYEKQILASQKKAEHLLFDIRKSIQYALRIQQAIIPNESELQKHFDCFVFFRPRDIVSGDFYWFADKGEKKILVVADCTGHGVSGAFMTMIGNNILNQIVHNYEIHEPDEILNLIPILLEQTLMHSEGKIKDGMDIAILTLAKNTVHYAGAMNPLYYVENQEFKEIKADKVAIGGKSNDEFSYQKHELIFDAEFLMFDEKNPTSKIKNPTFYLCSDGFQDQFGGENNTKFLVKNLKKLLLEISDQPIPQQKEILEQTFIQWQGTHKQTDDVLIIGIRL